jgi:hypothetical protein
MADSHPIRNGSRGRRKTRRDLALDEIEHLCRNMLVDLKILTTSVECVIAEAKEARK